MNALYLKRPTMRPRTRERGFTLIELVVVIGIAAFVVSAASMAVITMMRLSPQSSNWAIALRQVQDTGYWISRDVEMSGGDITIGDANPTFLTMVQPQSTPPNWTIVYETEAMDGGLKRLIRNNQTLAQRNIVAEYLSPPTAAYDAQTGRLTMTIAANSGGTVVTKTYQATQRVPTQ
ncbi:MAG TPA: type II secretion system protein [Dehalococcoidia bacterium]